MSHPSFVCPHQIPFSKNHENHFNSFVSIKVVSPPNQKPLSKISVLIRHFPKDIWFGLVTASQFLFSNQSPWQLLKIIPVKKSIYYCKFFIQTNFSTCHVTIFEVRKLPRLWKRVHFLKNFTTWSKKVTYFINIEIFPRSECAHFFKILPSEQWNLG